MKHELVLVIDFGGQYNQLIARRVRENNVYCEILPYSTDIEIIKAKNPKGIIFTGGPNSAYLPDSPSISKEIFEIGVPILGICYGHQLLADILGGKVGYNPKGMEVGTMDIFLTEDGKEDKLLGVLPKNFKGHEAHSQSVLELPRGAKLLAYNENDSVQSFSYDNHIWTTQFHPEFLSNITREYMKFDKEKIINSGKNYEKIYNKVEENKYGEILLKNFINIIKENK